MSAPVFALRRQIAGSARGAGSDALRRGCAALAAGGAAEAAQWFARARRLAPDDPLAQHMLAASLAAGDPERALGLLDDLLASVPRYRDARISRLTLLHRLRRPDAAARELDALLRRHAQPVAPGFALLADAVADTAARPGWVGVSGDGRVTARGATGLRLGDRPLTPEPGGAAPRLPPDWRRRGGTLVASGGVLGARIDLTGIARVVGAVARAPDGGLTGWAASVADPDTPPLIEVFDDPDAAAPIAVGIADDDAVAMHGVAPARGFRIALGNLPPGTTLHVRAQNGSNLRGSPLRIAAPPRHGVRPAAPGAGSWADGRLASATILVTHADGGGVERQVAARAARLDAEGARAIVVRPGGGSDGPAPPSGFRLCDGTGTTPPLPVASVEALADLLRGDRPAAVEFHHVAAHDPAVLRLPGLLRVPFDVVLHDFAAICPRVTLCGGADRYCGEPADRRDCEHCIADHGARIPFAGTVAAHRTRTAMLLSAARRVVAPSRDAADRLRRFVPRLAPVVTPWEDDRALTRCVRLPTSAPGAVVTVGVVGAIGVDKGFHVLLACARDAARRGLALRFVVVGHTIDDDRLLATERVFVTGRFAEGEAPALLAEFAPALGLLPSVWPETWCFALSALWQAGLHVLAFDLGAQAERIAATGAGTLLPLASTPAAINDRCLALARPATPRPAAERRLVHA